MVSLARHRPLARAVVPALVFASGTALAGCIEAPASPAERPATIVHSVAWFGDSLTWEAAPYARIGAQEAGQDLWIDGAGGTAPCDWTATVADVVARQVPEVVVLQFSGNAYFPCMHGLDGAPLTGDGWLAAYDNGIRALIAAAGPAEVLLVGTPPARSGDPSAAALNDLYRQVAGETGASFVDAGAAVTDGSGAYTDVLPCLPGEECAGVPSVSGEPGNQVRAADGVHFCPTVTSSVQGVIDPCPVHSSGALRYAAAVQAAITTALT